MPILPVESRERRRTCYGAIQAECLSILRKEGLQGASGGNSAHGRELAAGVGRAQQADVVAQVQQAWEGFHPRVSCRAAGVPGAHGRELVVGVGRAQQADVVAQVQQAWGGV